MEDKFESLIEQVADKFVKEVENNENAGKEINSIIDKFGIYHYKGK